jgi:hypothetical protein
MRCRTGRQFTRSQNTQCKALKTVAQGSRPLWKDGTSPPGQWLPRRAATFATIDSLRFRTPRESSRSVVCFMRSGGVGRDSGPWPSQERFRDNNDVSTLSHGFGGTGHSNTIGDRENGVWVPALSSEPQLGKKLPDRGQEATQIRFDGRTVWWDKQYTVPPSYLSAFVPEGPPAGGS